MFILDAVRVGDLEVCHRKPSVAMDLYLKFRDAGVEAAFWASAAVRDTLLGIDRCVACLAVVYSVSLGAHFYNKPVKGGAAIEAVLSWTLSPTATAALFALYFAHQVAVLWASVYRHRVFYARYRTAAMALQRLFRTLALAIMHRFPAENDVAMQMESPMTHQPASRLRVVLIILRLLLTKGGVVYAWLLMAQFPVAWHFNVPLHCLHVFASLLSAPYIARELERADLKEAVCHLAGRLDYFDVITPRDGSCHPMAATQVAYSVS